MFTGLAVAASVLGVIVLVAVVLVQRGRDGVDMSPHTLLRAYLYAASFAGLLVLVIGLSALLNWGIASATRYDIVYGGAPSPAIARACPPGVFDCPPQPSSEDLLRQQRQQEQRQLGEELLRGITFTVLGAVFYGAHRTARRGVAGAQEARSGLRRAYLMFGAAVFGLVTIVLVPTGLYQLLANAILATSESIYRPGIADSFTPGVVSLVIWLTFLRLVVRETRLARVEA